MNAERLAVRRTGHRAVLPLFCSLAGHGLLLCAILAMGRGDRTSTDSFDPGPNCPVICLSMFSATPEAAAAPSTPAPSGTGTDSSDSPAKPLSRMATPTPEPLPTRRVTAGPGKKSRIKEQRTEPTRPSAPVQDQTAGAAPGHGTAITQTAVTDKAVPVPGAGHAGTAAASAVLPVSKPPGYAHNPEPPYPDLARRRGWQGTVLLLVRVLADGSPAELALSRSSGYDLLDAAALRAVRGWRFQPGTSEGRTVAMDILVPVHFQLR